MTMNKNIEKIQNDFEEQDWRMSLPEEWTVSIKDKDGQAVNIPLRNHPALAKYSSKDDAVKALVHAQRLIGKRPEGYLAPPAHDASEEERAAFFTAIGRPENAAEYDFPEIELPENFELDEDLQSMFREKAHELGLTAEQVRGLYEWFLPLNIAAFQDMMDVEKRAQEDEMQTLRAVHRGEMPNIVEAARQAALALGGEELLTALTETGAGNRASVINAFARMAPSLLEGSLKGRSGRVLMSLSKEKLVEMMKDPRYHDPMQRDPSFVKEIEQGFDQLYPGKYHSGSRV